MATTTNRFLDVASFDQNAKVASHVHQFSHNMNFANVKVVGVESNYHERLFLEVWHSAVDPNAGKRSHRTSGSLQRHHVSMNYIVTRASFALRYFK